MGLIGNIFDRVLSAFFGNRRNVVRETAEVFRENAEAGAVREAHLRDVAISQFGAEFNARRGWFDQLIDGLNRLPRPLLAYGTLGLFAAAMHDPEWFASRMQGIALVPEPLWWLMGAIVSFYFGARHQAHAQDFQRSIAESLSRLPQVVAARAEVEGNETSSQAENQPPSEPDILGPISTRPLRYSTGPNPALDAWWNTRM